MRLPRMPIALVRGGRSVSSLKSSQPSLLQRGNDNVHADRIEDGPKRCSNVILRLRNLGGQARVLSPQQAPPLRQHRTKWKNGIIRSRSTARKIAGGKSNVEKL